MNERSGNYLDFVGLIQEANNNLASGVDFAFLPGDNADDGTHLYPSEILRRTMRSGVL